ncbi:cytochrome c oxidase subunit 6a, mitochondrial-like, partial [Phoenix dactylifera]|uniref:Cytochrome c oxidase subunit 6a, mitochondrial-like n=1 Tax=Phoenix dactylifera TaxID=42345 RepID=A0A8B7C2W4_PHODC
PSRHHSRSLFVLTCRQARTDRKEAPRERARRRQTTIVMAAARYGLRVLLRGGALRSKPAAGKRSFSSSPLHDDAHETAKWEKITYAGIVTCTVLSIYNLSQDHPHHPEPPAYQYLHVRNKEFPWGPDGLFERKHAEH